MLARSDCKVGHFKMHFITLVLKFSLTFSFVPNKVAISIFLIFFARCFILTEKSLKIQNSRQTAMAWLFEYGKIREILLTLFFVKSKWDFRFVSFVYNKKKIVWFHFTFFFLVKSNWDNFFFVICRYKCHHFTF